jgi:hypothetical protein
MAVKDRPFVLVTLPLNRGSVEPVDASKFKRVRFDVRGDGDYALVIPTREVRDDAYYRSPFRAEPQWKNVQVEFSSLQQSTTKKPAKWTAKDLLMLSVEIARATSEIGWVEIDNVKFYK